jgi:uncharacterized protein YqjF (DUF2071 family)
MSNPFLSAEWRKLAVANYLVDPALLLPYVPLKTELDFITFPGDNRRRCYISLVGFMFLNIRIKGVQIPFHVNFEEINLRFYVRSRDGNNWKRGVVFIREIASKPMVSLVANMLYNEHYMTMPTEHSFIATPSALNVEYRWKKRNWNVFRVATEKTPMPISEGSEEEFIFENYVGYTKTRKNYSFEYIVEHPKWETYPVRSYQLDVDFGGLYGEAFGFLSKEKPASVFLAEGSGIVVKDSRRI